jgi:preprotein translocase subunit SecG
MSVWITFFLVVQILIAAALVGVILMQRSEGGGLGIGGSPAGLMSARGAADFLTRTTTVLASIFILLCIVMAGISAGSRSSAKLDTTLVKTAPAASVNLVAPKPAPVSNPNDPLAALAPQAATNTASSAPFAAPPATPATKK